MNEYAALGVYHDMGTHDYMKNDKMKNDIYMMNEHQVSYYDTSSTTT
jgi:hypothetical protein